VFGIGGIGQQALECLLFLPQQREKELNGG